MKKRKLEPIMENVKRRWTRQIVQEKGYTQTTAVWMAERIEALIDWMQQKRTVCRKAPGIRIQ